MLSSVRLTLAACLVCIGCLYGDASAQGTTAPRVVKVEPPSWWAGHSINPVRLLVRGANLHGARVQATRSGAEPEAVTVNPAGTYAFISLRISPTARPGDYPLELLAPQGKTMIPFSLNAPLDASKNFQGITNDDIIYLIMPDRFANGDTSNDAPQGSPPAANDRRNPRGGTAATCAASSIACRI